MHAGGEAFARTADALGALAAGDRAAYDPALRAIVADFEARDAHLTGVAIADTAIMLDRLAEPRGLGGLPPASPAASRRRRYAPRTRTGAVERRTDRRV